MRVFISHAWQDKPLALALAQLPDFVDVWVDVRELLGGQSLEYAQHHAEIIARFGRFPHRNPLLGRASTQAELDYMAAGGFTG